MKLAETKNETGILDKLFEIGAHFGLVKSRRHPSTKPYLFGVKNKVEIFNLEKTKSSLDSAKEFVEGVAKERGVILFVGGKSEAKEALRAGAERIKMPYVAGRWLGGTLTNFSEIRKRISKLESLVSQKEKGELVKYTKKERLLIDREIEYLGRFFGGLSYLTRLPKTLFIIDSRREKNAVLEAVKLNIPIVSLSSSDCDLSFIDYPIPANDAGMASIKYFVDEIVSAYENGLKMVPTAKEETKEKNVV
ncbi:MAG: 30S ribosomal protein S2 [Candidatus Zambryskibacteria bacterium RIFCSPHIGHO2_01_FULL_43_25]|uniref:Small ribosomal subunit protein uS2 n=1 Tax=Candidatus Zambryskibacteria bacterium RIFCSPLOWO2_01_FULL_45_21 TaxID=1802761 RepID=A0A1G2U3Y9_9BACT|nr:MAG: 30S ribosomal protein S2 [Candidatus Zambryskibacteria bacterium RIFCSPHIGHO2_01_FULL_43_25]OHB00409.1 MAG: 30S ribosomal protein S2 [Candidatus Zambryskibacteria bacterium RIFCSPHIGHO2_12_FULL_44_12b]OHB04204.1 MAG: 30S ribosomal protein S2 [Candidatus Zambryskibacteria bacterium RIFCSPLOWO2_01_FULL_45_21]